MEHKTFTITNLELEWIIKDVKKEIESTNQDCPRCHQALSSVIEKVYDKQAMNTPLEDII